MSDEVPSGRLSQIFDPLTNLQQPTTHYQQQLNINRRRSASSSPSPSTSGRATPASAGATSNGSGASSSSSHRQQQQYFQQQQQSQQQPHNYQYLTQTHNYFQLRTQDVAGGGGGGGVAGGGIAAGGGNPHNYLHTFPSTTTQNHLLQQQQHLLQQQYQQHLQHQQQHTNMMPSSSYLQHSQQQQHSLPPLYGATQSLNSSPLLTKRAISFSGQIPLSRQQQQMDNSVAMRQQQQQQLGVATAQSTPNSPRLMPRRQPKPPPIPAKPTNIAVTGASTASTNSALQQKDLPPVNPVASLDGADAPWPHFSSLTEYLDVHQVNNYGQAVPEINWQERCLELQLELHRSKNQAGRIRDMLREKVSGILNQFFEFKINYKKFYKNFTNSQFIEC